MTLLLFILKENSIWTMGLRCLLRQFSSYSSQRLAVRWWLRQMTAGLFKQCISKWFHTAPSWLSSETKLQHYYVLFKCCCRAKGWGGENEVVLEKLVLWMFYLFLYCIQGEFYESSRHNVWTLDPIYIQTWSCLSDVVKQAGLTFSQWLILTLQRVFVVKDDTSMSWPPFG